MKKNVLFLLLAVVLLSLAAISVVSADPVIKDRLIIADASTLTQTDPMANNSTYNRRIYEMTHNTLINYDLNTGVISPGLAKSWEVSDDGLTYTFHLEEGVKFHNGNDCTAEDVVYSFERGKETSTLKTVLAAMESVEAVDDYTVKMNLNRNNVEFLIGISNNSCVVLDKEALDADPDRGGMIGTGPYIFTEWEPDDYVLLTRNDNYWGELPKSKEIMYRKIPEASARVIALRTGEIDVCMEVPAIEAQHVADAEGCQLIQLPSTKLAYVALNVSGYNKDVLDERVRKAFNYATDTESIIIAMTEGYGQPANGIIPQSIWGYYDGVQGYTYDVDKAKELLAEAGYANGLNISLSYNKNNFPGMYELLQAQWDMAGINLTLSTDDGSVASDQLRAKEYDMYMTQVLLTSIGDLNVIWHSTSGSNRTLTADPTLDAMLDEALTITDKDVRLAKYAEISQYLSDWGAMIPLYIDTLLFGVRDGVEGLELYGNGRHVLTYAYATE